MIVNNNLFHIRKYSSTIHFIYLKIFTSFYIFQIHLRCLYLSFIISIEVKLQYIRKRY